MPVTLVVLIAAVLHASWNALLKPLDERLGALALGLFVTGLGTLVAAPFVRPGTAALAYIGVSACLHVLYDVLLMGSYRVGDFNQVYPLARGTSPLVVTGVAAIVASEHLSGPQIAGVAVISAGLVLLAGRPRHAQAAATRLALATGVVIAAYTVIDGLGVRHSHGALAYSIWLFALHGPLVAVVARRSLRPAMPHLALGSLAAFMSLVAYALVIWAQRHGDLGPIAALRETSVVVAALIGAFVFKERLGARRVLASVVVVAGVVLLNA